MKRYRSFGDLEYYRRGLNGDLVIEPAGVAVVRRIYEMRAAGQSLRAIAGKLNDEGVPTPRQHSHSPIICDQRRE